MKLFFKYLNKKNKKEEQRRQSKKKKKTKAQYSLLKPNSPNIYITCKWNKHFNYKHTLYIQEHKGKLANV